MSPCFRSRAIAPEEQAGCLSGSAFSATQLSETNVSRIGPAVCYFDEKVQRDTASAEFSEKTDTWPSRCLRQSKQTGAESIGCTLRGLLAGAARGNRRQWKSPTQTPPTPGNG